MRLPEVRDRHLRAMKGQPIHFKGGNGRPQAERVEAYLAALKWLGWIPEYVIKTNGHRTPHNPPRAYKADLANPSTMTVVEMDGTSHRPRQRQELDRKKTEVLRALGWTVISNQSLTERAEASGLRVRDIKIWRTRYELTRAEPALPQPEQAGHLHRYARIRARHLDQETRDDHRGGPGGGPPAACSEGGGKNKVRVIDAQMSGWSHLWPRQRSASPTRREKESQFKAAVQRASKTRGFSMPRGKYPRTPNQLAAAKANLAKGRLPEARAKAQQSIRRTASDPSWREKVSRATQAAMRLPEVRDRHLRAMKG